MVHLYERALIPLNLHPIMWARYSEFLVSQDRIPEALNIWERGSKSAVSIDPQFLRLRELFAERTDNAGLGVETHARLSQLKSGEAVLAVVDHHMRASTATGDPAMKQRAQEVLAGFLATSLNPVDYAAASAALYKLEQPVDIEVLQSTCTKIPLALSLGVRALLDSGMTEQAGLLFKHFLTDEKSELNIEDRHRFYPVYVDFLRRHGSIHDVREAQRGLFDVERRLRVARLAERREKTKDIHKPTEIMESWIDFFQQTDALREVTAPANPDA
jgi:hypothetical protein